MRAPVSVVIPTLNAEKELAECLSCLFPGVQAGLIRELIVVDGGSKDGTVHLAQEAGATVVETKASRGHQLREGCAVAKGDWLLILHADSQLDATWVEVADRHLSRPKAGYFRLRFDQGGLMGAIVAGWANLRSRVLGLPFGDQGLLVPRTLYDRIGGYPDMALMEDVALARALSGHLVALDCSLATSARRYREQGWLQRGARNLWLQIQYFAGISPDKLAQAYHKR